MKALELHLFAGADNLQDKQQTELLQSLEAAVNVKVIDQGSFAFLEYDDVDAQSDCSVISGVHALQILPSSLALRCLYFPAIDSTLQAGPIQSRYDICNA